MSLELLDRYRGSLLGLACGDAVGTTVEFEPRGTFPPVLDMTGGGPFELPVGAWTDDTSMALCLAISLLQCDGFDARDQMSRYTNWWQWGYLSSTGECFDIGMTVCRALQRFMVTQDPMAGDTHPNSAGNGSLMRLAPIALKFAPDLQQVRHFSRLSSATTHAAAEALDCCELLGELLHRALAGLSKPELLQATTTSYASEKVSQLAQTEYRSKPLERIKGSGYCVESLEAALWCFDHTETFESAVLTAANLGDDADTTAAIVGQLAGAHYGASSIPVRWLEPLCMRGEIERLAQGLFEQAQTRQTDHP
ncbi:ADP-ribosylglycohydrolase family protein [Ideonella sp.]|uniref:ADP-ribosylglycohydrolase family protein n=1 Tax=Ideonella sp. TaxID=1929293 RepID=UPI003BB56C43